MIKASEALKLSKTDEEITKEYLNVIEKKIIASAQKGCTSAYISENPYASWLYDKSKQSKPVKDALKTLEECGYNVSFYYEEMSMGVDCALVIDWSIKKGGK